MNKHKLYCSRHNILNQMFRHKSDGPAAHNNYYIIGIALNKEEFNSWLLRIKSIYDEELFDDAMYKRLELEEIHRLNILNWNK